MNIRKNIQDRQNKPGAHRSRAGFSLVELLVTMTVFFVILFTVYTLITHYANATRTEQARIKMQQEARYLMSTFTQEIKEAGTMLTIANTWGNYAPNPASFTGIYPLNNTNFADGVIVATGNPYVMGYLKQPYNAGDAVMTLESVAPTGYTSILADSAPDIYDIWEPGDIGIVLNDKGYYVFQVTRVDENSNTLELRATPVYYSGLLFTTANQDGTILYQDPMAYKGGSLQYQEEAPVINLTNFSIYLFKEVAHPVESRTIRQFIRVTDTQGDMDVLADNTQASFSVISENIYDMQISYVGFQDFASANRNTTYDASYSFFGGTGTSINYAECIDRINRRYLKQVEITVVSITDTMGGRLAGEGATKEHTIPAIADQPSYKLPRGKYMYKIMSLTLEPRNYNIALKSLPL